MEGNELRARFNLFIGLVLIKKAVVKPVEDLFQCLFENSEIKKHSALIEFRSLGEHPDPVIMPMQVFALTVVIYKVMRRGKIILNSYLKHLSSRGYNAGMEKRLSALTANINIKPEQDPLISGIAYDSRAVKEGFLFIALPGLHVDGHDFIDKAVEKGAAAVLYSDDSFARKHENIAWVRTENTRTAMAPLAAAFYGRPADKLTTIGVTGTDGKTSTVFMIDQLLELCGRKSGFISTAACKTGTLVDKNPYRQSTPEAVEINMMLSQMIENDKDCAVIESTSHGLSELNNRLGGISFDAGVFTNLTHEHLEFHGTFEKYRNDKLNLFRKLKPSGFGVINLDDENSGYFIKAAPGKVFTCSITKPEADFFADDIKTVAYGSSFRLTIGADAAGGTPVSLQASIGMPGLFNIENTLEAFAVAFKLTGTDPRKLAELLPELSSVKGRMKVIDRGQPFTAIVDYAHTPGSFRRLFPDMREQTRGRLIAVFGSAGERDIEKRPEQGEIAAGYADILVLTDEDPRGDEPMQILEEIAAGAEHAARGESASVAAGRRLAPLVRGENLMLIPDRRAAITAAMQLAEEDDTVIMLGKGHESTIIYADGPIPWDEQTAAEEVLYSMGFGK